MSKILVIAAHPDDEVLGCGGTIAKLTAAGHNVFVAILSEGVTSRAAQREQADTRLVEQLKQQSQNVAKILGISKLYDFDLPDNRFDTLPLLDIVKLIEKVLSKTSPEIVYTHHHGDLNIDHQIVHRATLTATRPVPGQPVREVYTYEVPSSTEWSFCQNDNYFTPNVFVDITDTLATKIEALTMYDSETRSFPHPRSSEAITASARKWGSVSGLNTAEAFQLVRSIRKTGNNLS